MSLNPQLAFELAAIDRQIVDLGERPPGSPREIEGLAAKLLDHAQATAETGARSASIPRLMDFSGPAAARYAGHAMQCGSAAVGAAAQLLALSNALGDEAVRLRNKQRQYDADKRHLERRRAAVLSQMRSSV